MKLYTELKVKMLMLEAYKQGLSDVSKVAKMDDTKIAEYVVNEIFKILKK